MTHLVAGVDLEYFEVVSVHVDEGLDLLLEAAQRDTIVQADVPHFAERKAGVNNERQKRRTIHNGIRMEKKLRKNIHTKGC